MGNSNHIIRASKPEETIRPQDIIFRSVTTADIPELKELFRNTVLTVNARDYTTEEVADWASCGNRPGHWEKLLATLHFIAACNGQGRIIGFTSIRNDGYLHSMFIHKDYQRQGIASSLLHRIEAYAAEHGISEITSEVSITARPFFEKQGYIVELEQRAQANRLQLINYKMRKQMKDGNTGFEKVYQIPLGKVYPLLVNKATRKGRTQEEVDEIICWLTGYNLQQLKELLDQPITYGDFFRNSPAPNPARRLIKGSICGIRVEEIQEPLMQEIRYLDKLVDELAKGKPMDKILRNL